MIVDFNSDEKTPVAKEEFTRSAITGAKTGSRSCKRLVGIGSRIQVALEDFVTISVISKASVGLKHSNLDVQGVIYRWTKHLNGTLGRLRNSFLLHSIQNYLLPSIAFTQSQNATKMYCLKMTYSDDTILIYSKQF